MTGQQVLVTGAAGFIGSHLVDGLVRKGYSVRAMAHYNATANTGWLADLPDDIKAQIDIVFGDIRDPSSVDKAITGCERVFHLAALIAIPYSYDAPRSYIDTNVTGTLNVLEACRRQGVGRLVHTSTSEVYGSAQYTPIDEKHPIVAQSPYAASKVGADQLVESYHRSFELPTVTARPFNTFGPRQSPRAVIPTIITQLLAGRQEIQLGSLDTIRDLNYVTDTVAGFITAAEHPGIEGQTINFGRGSGISIGDLAKLLASICEVDLTIVQDPSRMRPQASEVTELVCGSELAKRLTGWEPAFTMEEGLRHTVDWFRARADQDVQLDYRK